MKRRKRKRGWKAAGPPTIPVDAEKAGPFSVLIEGDRQIHPGDEFTSTVDPKEPEGGPGTLSGAEDVIDLGDELITAVEEEKPPGDSVMLTHADHHAHSDGEAITAVQEKNAAGPSDAPAGADRRTHPRYEFAAAAEVAAAESGARIETRVRDLSQQGCYVDTSHALPLGTVTEVRITKGAQLFEAQGRVVYSRASQGMGLVFTAMKPEQRGILETWLAESRETSWLAANRRRSQRVLMAIPVRVSGKTGEGSPFEEETQTRAISAHGALISVLTPVHRGQRLTLSNTQAKAALECVVAHINKQQRDHPQVGVEFLLPNPMFWHVTFPPKDWTPRHPHAKSPPKTDKSS